MDDLLKEKSLEPFLQKEYVSMAWQIQTAGQMNKITNQRAPASTELDSILKEFKQRFKIP